MNPDLIYAIALTAMCLSVIFLSVKFGMLKEVSDPSNPKPPYSWSRVQLAWWTVIVLSSFIAILFVFDQAPTLSTSTVVLLGISAATTATARVIESAPEPPPVTTTPALLPPGPAGAVPAADAIPPAPPQPSQGLLLDILSDKKSVSIPRFQTVVFNLAFGIWFVVSVFQQLHRSPDDDINSIMPDFATTNLVLLGLSSATYAALKTKEQ